MGIAEKKMKLQIKGMTCVNCQKRIQKKLNRTAGVNRADVSFSTGDAEVIYDADIVEPGDVIKVIEELGYEAAADISPADRTKRAVGLLAAAAALYIVIQQFGILNLLVPEQLADAKMGYGMLFLIGLMTSVHCVAMCGGINLSQSISRDDGKTIWPALYYNLGRVISYTVIGFIVGMLGSAITFTATAQGMLKLAAGLIMMMMGIRMLDIFPFLRKVCLPMPKVLSGRAYQRKVQHSGPFGVGLLNGLMPCGPLQAMQIYALSTGSPWMGALSMLIFSLGTVPLMFTLGAVSSLLKSRGFGRRVMTAGAVLVVVLGLAMVSQGWNLTGAGPTVATAAKTDQYDDLNAASEEMVQVINSTLSQRGYPAITVEPGRPVKWVIDAPNGTINGCNYRFFVKEYDIDHTFEAGENIIEFTPEQEGTFRYTCWMGMIQGTITVTSEAGK